MCGISGIYSSRKKTLELDFICKKMIDKIIYRGPDEQLIKSHKNFSGGVARLAIESIKTSQQPVENEKYILGFNGEIFNYKDLIKKYNLSNSIIDSEAKLLLKLFEIKKNLFVEEISGQFAIFIYDKHTEEIYLFRDRYGIRPLFYFYNNNELIFSSEIKSIVSTNFIDFKINYKSIQDISLFWTNTGSRTSIDNIKSLKPGHYIKFNRNECIENKYFLNSVLKNENNLSNTIDKNELYEKLKDAVKNQIHGEVGYACYLSGGIDSAALAYILSHISSSQLETFSVEFENNDYDESFEQNEVSQFLKTKHNSIKINSFDIANNFEDVIDHCETILFRTAPVPMYLLSKLVNKKKHKVIYTGEGADEILFGYDIFLENRARRFWNRNKDSVFRGNILQKIYNYLPQFNDPKQFKATKLFYRNYLNNENDLSYSHIVRWSQYTQISKYFNFEKQDMKSLISDYKAQLPKNFKLFSSDRKAQYIEIDTLLSNYLLSSQGDRVSMANSVEGRYPFLDQSFTEYCSNIKTQLLSKSIRSKELFRQSFANKLPDSIINRPKVAYQAPEISAFMSEKFISRPAEELLDSIKDNDIINQENFNSLVNKIRSPNHYNKLTFRDNMSFIMILSIYFLNKRISEWKK